MTPLGPCVCVAAAGRCVRACVCARVYAVRLAQAVLASENQRALDNALSEYVRHIDAVASGEAHNTRAYTHIHTQQCADTHTQTHIHTLAHVNGIRGQPPEAMDALASVRVKNALTYKYTRTE
jgi:hypothetical protein